MAERHTMSATLSLFRQKMLNSLHSGKIVRFSTTTYLPPAKIGHEYGVIIVTDRVLWPDAAINTNITVTGKDPRTGETFESASLERRSANARPTLTGTGSFTISYITDYNPGDKHNCPIVPKLPEFTLGEGYKFSKLNDSGAEIGYTAEVSGGGCATDMVMNFAGAIRFADFYNWASNTYNGSITYNIMPTAKFYNWLAIGGDTGDPADSSTCNIKGAVFANIYNNQNNITLRIGGYPGSEHQQ